MSLTSINNAESGSSARTKINAAISAINLSAHPRVIHVTTAGNDTTGDGSPGAPYLTAQKAFEVALASSGDYVIQCGVGDFGTVIPSANWPSRITIRGAGYKVSRLTGINAGGAAGANSTGFNGQNAGNGTAGKNLTIRSDQSISLGAINTNGGAGGAADAWGTASSFNSGTPGAAGGNGGNGAPAGDIDLIGCVHERISAESGGGGAGGEGQTGASTDDGAQAADGGVGGDAGIGGDRASISLLSCFQLGASKDVTAVAGEAGSPGSPGAGGTDVLNGVLNGSAGASGGSGAAGASTSSSSIIKSTVNILSISSNVTAHSCWYVQDNAETAMAGGTNNFQLTEAQLGMI